MSSMILSCIKPFLIGFPVLGIIVGFCLWLLGFDGVHWIWAASTVPVLLTLFSQIVLTLRRGEMGLDILAALSMSAALFFGEELAAAVVALMYGGGQYLEGFAERHARREMTALLSRVPRSALRHRDGELEEIGLELVEVGDCLFIRQGDIVPVDGNVCSGVAVLDESDLTGESIPVQRKSGQSDYERLDLCRGRVRPAGHQASSRKHLFGNRAPGRGSPALQGADVAACRPFLDSLSCGKALEMMAHIRVLVVDKTGTLTDGRAKVVAVRAEPGLVRGRCHPDRRVARSSVQTYHCSDDRVRSACPKAPSRHTHRDRRDRR
jgi:cation transport ATPase